MCYTFMPASVFSIKESSPSVSCNYKMIIKHTYYIWQSPTKFRRACKSLKDPTTGRAHQNELEEKTEAATTSTDAECFAVWSCTLLHIVDDWAYLELAWAIVLPSFGSEQPWPMAQGSATFEAMASYEDHEEDHHDGDGDAGGQPNLLGAVPSPGRAELPWTTALRAEEKQTSKLDRTLPCKDRSWISYKIDAQTDQVVREILSPAQRCPSGSLQPQEPGGWTTSGQGCALSNTCRYIKEGQI